MHVQQWVCVSDVHGLATLQPGQSAPEMAAAAAAAAVVREAAASAVMDVLDAGESEEEKTTKLALAKEDKMRKVIRLVFPTSSVCEWG